MKFRYLLAVAFLTTMLVACGQNGTPQNGQMYRPGQPGQPGGYQVGQIPGQQMNPYQQQMNPNMYGPSQYGNYGGYSSGCCCCDSCGC